MRDALDADGIWAAIRDAGLELPGRPYHSDLEGRLVNVFLKRGTSQDGQVRGRRNAMLDHSDVHWHRQIKSCVGGHPVAGARTCGRAPDAETSLVLADDAAGVPR